MIVSLLSTVSVLVFLGVDLRLADPFAGAADFPPLPTICVSSFSTSISWFFFLTRSASEGFFSVPGLSVATLVRFSGVADGPGEDERAFDENAIEAADTVFDVLAFPSETQLVLAARRAGKQVITGAEVIALQAAEQFWRYTGMRPTPEQVAAASAFSRA